MANKAPDHNEKTIMALTVLIPFGIVLVFFHDFVVMVFMTIILLGIILSPVVFAVWYHMADSPLSGNRK